jgi:hypothetical protein
MAVSPEVLFERFFQEHFPYTPPVRPEDADQRTYKGRHDLGGLRPSLQAQLRTIQETYNQALRNEKQGVREHVAHPPFHLDYVDSDVQNALAFQHEGYSFIGITIPSIFAISDVCLLLSRSATLATLLGVRPPDEDYNQLHAALFYILTAFIVGHEWTHHVHGHVRESATKPILPNEIPVAGIGGNLEVQVQEIVADGYSVYHVLTNVIDSPNVIDEWTRSTLLGAGGEQTSWRDKVLFSMCIVAIAGYLFIAAVPDVTRTDLYQLTHPPQAVRMRFIALEASSWCSHFRPELDEWMTTRYMALMSAVADATKRCSDLGGPKDVPQI